VRSCGGFEGEGETHEYFHNVCLIENNRLIAASGAHLQGTTRSASCGRREFDRRANRLFQYPCYVYRVSSDSDDMRYKSGCSKMTICSGYYEPCSERVRVCQLKKYRQLKNWPTRRCKARRTRCSRTRRRRSGRRRRALRRSAPRRRPLCKSLPPRCGPLMCTTCLGDTRVYEPQIRASGAGGDGGVPRSSPFFFVTLKPRVE